MGGVGAWVLQRYQVFGKTSLILFVILKREWSYWNDIFKVENVVDKKGLLSFLNESSHC